MYTPAIMRRGNAPIYPGINPLYLRQMYTRNCHASRARSTWRINPLYLRQMYTYRTKEKWRKGGCINPLYLRQMYTMWKVAQARAGSAAYQSSVFEADVYLDIIIKYRGKYYKYQSSVFEADVYHNFNSVFTPEN